MWPHAKAAAGRGGRPARDVSSPSPAAAGARSTSTWVGHACTPQADQARSWLSRPGRDTWPQAAHVSRAREPRAQPCSACDSREQRERRGCERARKQSPGARPQGTRLRFLAGSAARSRACARSQTPAGESPRPRGRDSRRPREATRGLRWYARSSCRSRRRNQVASPGTGRPRGQGKGSRTRLTRAAQRDTR